MSKIPDHLQHKHRDIRKKMEMAKNIVKECYKEMQNRRLYIILKSELKRFRLYTGLNSANIIIKDLRNQIKMSKKFKDDLALHTLDSKIYGCLESYDKIRDFVYNTYVEKRTIPTTEEVSTIKDAFVRHTQKNFESKLKWTFKRTGFMLKQLPGTNKAIIVERAEQTGKRNEFINKIRHYRETNRYIIYVVDTKRPLYLKEFFHIEDLSPKFLITAAFPGGGWVKSTVRSNSYHASNFLEWFSFNIVPCLPESSVIVIEEDSDITGDVQRVPTALSGKQDMVKWLEKNQIPHDPNAHRAELFKLIEKTRKHIKNIDKFSELMEVHGHTVLIKPDYSSADYFKGLYSCVLKKLPDENIFNNKKSVLAKDLSAAINGLTAEELRECERILIESEIKVLDDDMMVEEIVEKLLTMASYGGISEKDLEGLDNYKIDMEQNFVVHGDQDSVV